MELKIHFAILPTLGIPVERREPDGGRNREEKRTERRKKLERGKPRTGEERTERRKKPGGEKPDRAKNREAKRTGRFLG